MNSKYRPRLALLASVAGCLVFLSTPSYAQTRPVTLAWDASPEPSVAGYIVYVGNASGSYGERYDVGNQTSFVYTRVSTGVPYFFAVAAYVPGRGVGPRSEETFFLGGATAATASSMPAPSDELPSRTLPQPMAIAGTVHERTCSGLHERRRPCDRRRRGTCADADR